MSVTLLLIASFLVGALLARIVARLPRGVDALVTVVLVVGYVAGLLNLAPGSNEAQALLAGAVGYGVVAVMNLARDEIPRRREERRRINAAEASIREHQRIQG